MCIGKGDPEKLPLINQLDNFELKWLALSILKCWWRLKNRSLSAMFDDKYAKNQVVVGFSVSAWQITQLLRLLEWGE